jgi:nucleoside-diphosphate-sugar epimerase
MAKQPTIAITGAGGFLGSTLTDYFANKGWQVIGLVRNPQKQSTKQNVTYVAYDIAQPVDASMLKGVDYLVHTAYIKYSRQQPDALAINLTGAKNLLQASRHQKVKKNVFISSMSAHDDAESIYGKQKLAIEKLFDTPQDISLRCGLIIGNGGIVKEMVDFMRSKHLVPLIGGGTQPLQSVAVGDLCKAIEASLQKPVHGVLTIANPDVFSYRTFYETIAEVFGIKVAFLPVPFWALMAAAQTIETLRLPLGFGKDNVLGLKQLKSSDNAADLKALGIQLMPLRQALTQAKA